jgi:hypothetical protein
MLTKVATIEDPPCVTLHVETALIANPSTPGFNAEAKREMLRAIAEIVDREDFDGYCIVWSVPTPDVESKTPIGWRTGTSRLVSSYLR